MSKGHLVMWYLTADIVPMTALNTLPQLSAHLVSRVPVVRNLLAAQQGLWFCSREQHSTVGVPATISDVSNTGNQKDVDHFQKCGMLTGSQEPRLQQDLFQISEMPWSVGFWEAKL
jgi:hypothetical protein